jgi:hypothetical protein
MTVSEPPVALILPVTPPQSLDTAAIILSEPPVAIILPVTPPQSLDPNSITVSEPPVALILPAGPSLDQAALGITVSEPPVALILPAAPGGATDFGGITVSEPVVLLQFEPEPTTAPLVLNRIEINTGSTPKQKIADDAAWQVTLEWSAPEPGAFTIESSIDLVNWFIEPAQVAEIAPKQFRAHCALHDEQVRFYRVTQK